MDGAADAGAHINRGVRVDGGLFSPHTSCPRIDDAPAIRSLGVAPPHVASDLADLFSKMVFQWRSAFPPR